MIESRESVAGCNVCPSAGQRMFSFIPWRLSLVLLVLVFAASSSAHAQTCTQPDGVPGDVMYNSAFGVFQGCTTRGWAAFHNAVAADPCTTTSTVGTECIGGQVVYAGTHNGNRLYTTKTDQSAAAYWGAAGVSLGANAQSTTNGLLNTNTAWASIEANPQAGGCTSPYNPPACTPNAHVLCKELRTTLGGDWYLPATDELQAMLLNGAAIGGFISASYWSSTYAALFSALSRQYPGGASGNAMKNAMYSVRCVRQ